MTEQREINSILICRAGTEKPTIGRTAITEERIPLANSLNTMYQLLKVRMVEPLELVFNGQVVTAWCDEEALLNIEPENFYTLYEINDDTGRQFEILGCLLLTGGPDREGRNSSCPLTKDEVTALVANKQIQQRLIMATPA